METQIRLPKGSIVEIDGVKLTLECDMIAFKDEPIDLSGEDEMNIITPNF